MSKNVKKTRKVLEVKYGRPTTIVKCGSTWTSQQKGYNRPALSFQILPIAISQLAKVDDIAEMYKYNIVLASTSDEDDDKERVSVVNTLFSKQVDGIIFMGIDRKIHAQVLTFAHRSFWQVLSMSASER